MFDRSGTRRQEFMRGNPANDPVRNNDRIYKGIINAVFFRDFVHNGVTSQQTFVDLALVGMRLPELKKVPVAGSKANLQNGESWAPEEGDMVLVQFINGNVHQPVVTGYLYPADVEKQGLTPSTADVSGGSRYYRRCNRTTEEIKKDGTREVYVDKDEILVVKGHGTVTIQEGNLAINVQTGTATINVAGNAEVHSDGNLTASAVGTATVSGAIVDIESSGQINITGSGAIVASGASLSVTSTGSGTTTVSSGGTMNIQGSGNINLSGTGTVSISGANIAVSDT